MKWTPDEDEYLIANYGNIPNSQIGEELDRSKAGVWKRAKRLGLKSDQRKMASLSNRVHSHDSDFFQSFNEVSCYWAGFIAADGWVSNKQNSLGIKVHSRDRNHLETFANCLSFSGPIIDGESMRHGCFFSFSTCVIYSAKQLLLDLQANFNITQGKTKIYSPPKLKTSMAVPFLIGLIDGDGCICRYKQKNRYDYCELSVVGTLDTTVWVKEIFSKLGSTSKAEPRKQGSIYKLSSYGIDAEKLIHKLSEIDVPRLSRKWGKI